jgi:hypothetical protein
VETFIILALLFTGCRVEKRQETTVYDPNLQNIIDETCGSIEPMARKDVCIDNVAAWYYSNQIDPKNVTGRY